jgi:hypothetical protein
MTNKAKIVLAATLFAAFTAPALAQDVGEAQWFPYSASRCIVPQDGNAWFPGGSCQREPVFAQVPQTQTHFARRNGAPVRGYAANHRRTKHESLVRAN